MISIFIIFLVTSFSFVGAMELNQNPSQQYITSPHTASEMCNDLVIKLHNQPLFTGTSPIVKKCRVLPLCDIDSHIISLLSENVAQKLKFYHMIHHFGNGNYQLYDINRKYLGDGITQWLGDDEFSSDNETKLKEALASGEFKRTCGEVINDMRSGWKQSTLADNPDIFSKQSEEDFALFIKPKKLICEDILVNCFCVATGIQRNLINCDWTYSKTNGGHEFRDMMYLWIKKSSFNDVVSKLGLRID